VIRHGGNGYTNSHEYNIGNAVVAYNSGSPTATINFVHSDNQGSVIATTGASGQVMGQDIYDPFGK
jgi:hypothetical protein